MHILVELNLICICVRKRNRQALGNGVDVATTLKYVGNYPVLF